MMSSVDAVSSLVELGWGGECGGNFPAFRGRNCVSLPFFRPLLLLLLSRFSRVRLCDPIDGSPPGSPDPGILQARTLEWVAISFSNACK